MISGFCESHTCTFFSNIVLGKEERNFENRVTTSHETMTTLLFTPLTCKMQGRGGAPGVTDPAGVCVVRVCR